MMSDSEDITGYHDVSMIPTVAESLAREALVKLFGREIDEEHLRRATALMTASNGASLTTLLRELADRAESRLNGSASLRNTMLEQVEDGFFSVQLDLRNSMYVKQHLGAGWSGSEAFFTWAVETETTILLPAYDTSHDCILFMDVAPHVVPGRLEFQSLTVLVNGFNVGEFVIKRDQVISCFIRRQFIDGKVATVLTFKHPNGARPIDVGGKYLDDRRLSFRFSELRLQQITPSFSEKLSALQAGLTRPLRSARKFVSDRSATGAEVCKHFQSIGDNCEFGLAQRAMGYEGLGLFRFSSVPLSKVVYGILSDFAGLDDSGHIKLIRYDDDDHDYMIQHSAYKMLYHTGRKPGDAEPDELLRQQSKRLKFLGSTLLEDFEDGQQIFVIKRNSGISNEEMVSLLSAVSSKGKGTVLWVDVADDQHPPGSVDLIIPGLMKGYIERFALLGMKESLISRWSEILFNAYDLAHG